MTLSIPDKIRRYRVTPVTPSEWIVTLALIYAETADAAAAVSDRALARICQNRYDKTVAELIRRNYISDPDSIFDTPAVDFSGENPREMTVDALFHLFRQSPLRTGQRRDSGREHLTCLEDLPLISELRRRTPADFGQWLKIHYCRLAYSNRLENLSRTFSLPVSLGNDKIYPAPSADYTPEELLALIRLYTDYRDIAEREILIRYVDIALDLMERAVDRTPMMELAAEIMELGRRHIINVPSWTRDFLADAISAGRRDSALHPSRLVIPLLTLHLADRDPALEREAASIINRCYTALLTSPLSVHTTAAPLDPLSLASISDTIDNLHIAITCSDYIPRFNLPAISKCWNTLCSAILPSDSESELDSRLTARQLVTLKSIADEIEGFALLSSTSTHTLRSLQTRSTDLLSRTHFHRLNVADSHLSLKS